MSTSFPRASIAARVLILTAVVLLMTNLTGCRHRRYAQRPVLFGPSVSGNCSTCTSPSCPGCSEGSAPLSSSRGGTVVDDYDSTGSETIIDRSPSRSASPPDIDDDATELDPIKAPATGPINSGDEPGLDPKYDRGATKSGYRDANREGVRNVGWTTRRINLP